MTRAKTIIAFAVAIGALWGTAVPATANFHAKSYPAQVKGEKIKNPQFVDKEDTTSCQLGKYEGILLADSEQLKLAPKYGECTAIIKGEEMKAAKIVIEMNGCTYNYHQKLGKLTGTVTIGCPAGNEIKIKQTIAFIICEQQIGPQGPLGGVTYANVSSTPKTFSYSGTLIGLVIKNSPECKVEGAEGEVKGELDEKNSFRAFKTASPFEQVDLELL